MQPRLREAQLAANDVHGDRQHRRGFLRCHAAEIAHFNELHFQRIRASQPAKRLVHDQQGLVRMPTRVWDIGELHLLHRAALGRAPGTGQVHKDLAHQPGCNPKKV